jgi:elongation factor P
MAVLGHTDLKVGTLIELEGVPYRVTDYTHKAMGRGGAVVQVKIKNLLTGNILEKSFRSADKINSAEVVRSNMQLLYREGDNFVLMDNETYDQDTVPVKVLGDQAKYVAEGATIQVLRFVGSVIGMEMPNAVYLAVTQTEPGAKGDTATTALKPATLETGAEVMVPLFINEGDRVKVNTLSGDYLERAK